MSASPQSFSYPGRPARHVAAASRWSLSTALVYTAGMQDKDEAMLVAFGEFVRAQRRLAKVSQRHLAKMSGVSDSYLSQLERGNYRPSPQVVKALAQAFGLEPRQLYMMLGFMDADEDGGSPSVEQAIHLDEKLDASQKETLIRVYRSLLGKEQ